MKLLDERGIGTVWSICKEKFALSGHTHNYAGSGSPGGSANSAIGVVDYNQTGKTIQIGYSGAGITGDQIKYIAGYTDGSGNVNAKIKDVSKDALRSWLGLGSLAYSSSSIPTNLSQLNNDKGFVTGSVSGNTVTINGVSTTWTNTWRGIQDNLTSTSTYESLSANQGRVLKGLVDGKANSSHTHNYLPLSGGTLTGDLLFSNSGTTFRQIKGTCGDNDFWRIGGGATGNNAGYMEIATADDGTEPIYVRQYSGTFNTITRTATLLDGSGNTSFPGTVAAVKFKGALEGNASTASNAATVNGHTVNSNVPANAKFTDTNTWRGIQDNLTSTSTSDSLSANQGRILKNLVDSKANKSDISGLSYVGDFRVIDEPSRWLQGRLNLCIYTSSDIIDLNIFDQADEGLILFLVISNRSDIGVCHSYKMWLFGNQEISKYETITLITGKTYLITKIGTTVRVIPFY